MTEAYYSPAPLPFIDLLLFPLSLTATACFTSLFQLILLHHCWMILFFASESRFSMSDMWDWYIFSLRLWRCLEFYSRLWCNGERTLMCLSGVSERKGLQIPEAWKAVCEMWPQYDPALDIKGLWVTGGSVNKAVSRQFKPFKLLISQQHPPNNQFSTVSASLIVLVWGVSWGKATLITLQKQLL